MESYGAILRKKREEKGLDFDTISRDTSIASNYLKALEEEDSAAFPGEPYLVGFLRNYSEYLELDTPRLLQLYHSKVLQESPVPAGLIVHERPKYVFPLIIALVCVFCLAGVFGAIFYAKHKTSKNASEYSLQKSVGTKRYELSEKPLQARLYKGDQLILGTLAGNVVVTVANTQNTLGLETPAGIQYIELSEELEVDVDGDSVPEMIVYVSDVSSDSNDRGAEVRILLKSEKNAVLGETKTSEIPNAQDLPENKKRIVIFEDTRAYPFTIRADFRAGCVFRYRVDRKDAEEDYFANGDTVNMTANNGVRMWISNGNTVKLQIFADSKTYDLGVTKAGEVIVQDIRWIKDTDGKYKLVINEID
ncbi:helix-turn-helix domain-containing protein [Treponema pectinovorum]|uniref:helix-turn-helix domain-containing protein n=1 Tax=Treponema pectinovorum TaxID=164 RepID=UPI003D92FBA9